ncbi:class I SAM-dependent methyltransferase [Phytohabitans sp. ZYX-F-186]|uniref:Class I SAM-dependent methyltransferase n=1 Tax=Phytohabitans maris TaxID=3071409 RepID=A0ABU0ZK43_9ACTN|nr:class I SAM-dependent methyltransferase [Phytohabitans sp. ZYX-F-186]MDQ7907425.1 class I SAM-dependent methyltransferase [Phytohabitans sp. ZYX-F-186]
MTVETRTGLTRAALFDMMHAYKTTALLRTAVELGVFEQLAGGPLSVEAMAARTGVVPRGASILLHALAAVGLLDTVDGGFALPAGGEELLVRGRPAYFGDMVHVVASDWEWDALKVLTKAVRGGGAVVSEHAETPRFGYWEDFAAYAGAVAGPTAAVLADAIDGWAGRRESLDILDVACGHGIYGFTVAARHGNSRLWSLDWPNVLEVTARHAERLGLRDRMHPLPGDMFTTPLGGPYDLVMVTNVLHHFSAERATELLRRLTAALKPDGRLVVVGFTRTDAPPERDPSPHLFSVLMLVWTAEGEVHSAGTYDEMLRAAGLIPAKEHTPPGLPLTIMVTQPAST